MSDDSTFQGDADHLVIGGPESPKSHKRWWIGGLALCLIGAGGGAAAWAATSFFSTGDQPAEALPDTAIAYVSVDLDPSGGQKIQAMKLARKFPAFKDKVGLDTSDDIRKWIVDEAAKDGDCDIDYERDVAPWIGSRAAVAGVGAKKPFPVIVLQTTDADKADAALKKIAACDTDEHLAWRTEGDWTVLAETEAHVDEVVAGAEKGSLADDDDFQKWTKKAGDSGILTAYAAPAAGALLAEQLTADTQDSPEGIAPEQCPGLADGAASAERMKSALADFTGAAATLRFNDDGVEFGMVADGKTVTRTGLFTGKPSGTPVVTTLPADTAAALGFSLPKGWTDGLSKTASELCDTSVDLGSALAPFSQLTGLSLPGDLEKLLGDSVAVAVGSDIDVEALVNSGDPSRLPVALKTRGDKATVDKLIAKIREQVGPAADSVKPVAGDDSVVLALDGTYAAEVARKGDLGSAKAFTSVVPHGDEASAVVYVNVDELDSVIAKLANDDPEVVDNLKPLRAFGMSSWVEGDDAHSLLKISLD